MRAFQTAQDAIRYAFDKQLDMNAAKARTDIRATDKLREARNKRDWAMRHLETDFAMKPESDSDDAIESFLRDQYKRGKK